MRPPGPTLLEVLMQAPRAGNGLLPPLSRFTQKYGPVVRIPMLGPAVYFFQSPEDVKEVLQDQAPRLRRSYQILKSFLGEGILTSDGETWREQRRMLSPVFHFKSIQNFYSIMREEAERLTEIWEGDGLVRNVEAELMKTTLNIVARSLVSADLRGDAELIGNSITAVMEVVTSKFKTLLPTPLSWPSPTNRRFHRAVMQLDHLVYRLVKERREEAQPGEDMLGLFLALREEESGRALDDREMRDQITTMILAGHETTATMLTWTLYLLATHPEIQERVSREVRDLDADGQPKLADLSNLHYMMKVYKESLRLYPPFWYLERSAPDGVRIGRYDVPPGSRVAVSPYLTHRDPEVWENPERFDPDRFDEEPMSRRHKFAWIPFGAGPRTCMGQAFAQMEIQVILSRLLARYRFYPVEGHPIDLNPLISLRPRHGMKLRIERR